MKIKLTLLSMVLIFVLMLSGGTAIAQEMEVIRALNGKIVGNQGSENDVARNQTFTIYRIMPTGPRSIGLAIVIDVKKSICVLDVELNDSALPVKNGDILIIEDNSQSDQVVTSGKIPDSDTTKKSSPHKGRIGIRGGIGTDTGGGLVGGGSLSYLVPTYPNPFEIGFLVLSGTIEETIQETNSYVERTDLLTTSLYLNYLFNYNYSPQSLYFMIGAGISFIDVMWEMSSDTDESLGKLLPEGGSTRSDEGGSFGLLFQFGLGYKLSQTVDTRFEVPILFIKDSPGEASSIATSFVLSLGIRFN
jgi:hypothetical protein